MYSAVACDFTVFGDSLNSPAKIAMSANFDYLAVEITPPDFV